MASEVSFNNSACTYVARFGLICINIIKEGGRCVHFPCWLVNQWLIKKHRNRLLKSFAILFKPVADLNVFMLKSPRR